MASEYRKYLRCFGFLISSVVIAIYFKHQIAIAFLLLAIFFYAMDVRKAGLKEEDSGHSDSGPIGILGSYIVDDTDSYGMFVEIAGSIVFIDLSEDNFLEIRKERAIYLFKNLPILEESLRDYVSSNPEFANRKISYICLHNKNVKLGEIFWDPHGHTTLDDLKFT